MRKKFLIENVILLSIYLIVHCFVQMILNFPSVDYDMWLELNINNVVTVYIYYSIGFIVNLICVINNNFVKRIKDKVINIIIMNLINLIYCGLSYYLFLMQANLLTNNDIYKILFGVMYVAITQVLSIIFINLCKNSPRILKYTHKKINNILSQAK